MSLVVITGLYCTDSELEEISFCLLDEKTSQVVKQVLIIVSLADSTDSTFGVYPLSENL